MEMKEFDQWNVNVDVAIQKNNELFLVFDKWLTKNDLKSENHRQILSDVSFFANSFLTRFDVIPIEQGIQSIDEYLGDFFIREIPWANPDTIKSTANNLKALYLFFLKTEKITSQDYDYLENLIHSELEQWIKNYYLFNSSCEL